MSNIENQICEAIELIVNKSINEARYDKTIQATVLEQDSVTGKYKCRYQDSIIYAYTTSNEKVYQKNTLVYILVPENDMSNAKTILGSVENLGSDYVSVVEENQRYETIGNNVVLYGDNNFNLSSYSEYGTGINPKVLYQKNLGGNLVSINNTFKDYLASTDTFGLAVTIQTNLPKEQQQQGNYGIIVGLDFKDEQSELSGTDSNAIITRYYILDIDSMKGNPYKLTKATKQKIYFNIDTASFVEVNSIAVFAKDFPHQSNSATSDISFSQIELTAERKLTQEELDGCSLTFVTSKGTIFREDSDASSILPVEVAIRAKGEIVDASKLSFYWFKEDSAVNEKHSKYNYIGGKGWYCLNQYNLISTADGINQVDWIAAGYKYNIAYADVKSKTATYKCAVIYNDNVYFKTLNIENKAWFFDLTIESSNGTDFYSDAGTSTLTCNVATATGAPIGELSYSWSIEKASGAVILLPDGNINEIYCGAPAGNVLPNVQIKNIEDYSIFKCSVHSDDIYLGTATIQLKNIKNAAFNLYNLILRGGKEVYKYDIYGTAPTSVLNENPMIISPLDFSLLTPNGDELDLSVLDVEWIVPKTSTMLIYNGQQENSENYKSDSDYHYIKNVRNLPYTILSNYNESYKNNTISLIVKYKGLIFTKDTEFVFLKEGELGTNGTQYICKIYPNTEESLDSYPIFMVDSYAASQGRFNFNFPSIADDPSTVADESLNNRTNVVGNNFTVQPPFVVKVFKNNEEIYNSKTNHSNTATDGSTVELKWEFLRNTYAAGCRDTADFEVNETGCLKWCGNSLSEADRTQAPANILKCTATISGSRDADKNYIFKKFTVSNVVPIIRAIKKTDKEVYVRFLKNSGFQTVEYGIDGSVPKYNKSKPFEVALYDGSGVDITLDETWNWSTKKQTYNVNSREVNDINSNEIIASYQNRELTNSHQWYVEPVLQYNGITVTNTVVCSNSKIQLSIPVYLYLAKNTIAEINGWDGNTLTVNEDGGFIMSPKVGVGEKDNEGNFTGLFMGGFQDGVHDEINGMLGFHRGERTIFLDAESGKAEFGKAGHQIVVDPSEGKAEINGNYDADAGTGMKIDFENPSIRYGNGKFEVNEVGELKSTAGQIGGYDIGTKDLQGSMVGISSIPDNKVVNGITQRDLKDIAFWAGDDNRKNAPFRVAFDGSVNATKLKISSNNFSDELKQELDETYLSTDFKVDEDSIVAKAKKETITELGGKNLIVLSTITEENKKGRLSNVFNTTSYLYAQEGYMTTEPISVEVGEDYYISSRSAVCGYVAVGYFKAGDIYSERPVMINASSIVGQKITIPEGVLYCRVSFNEGDKYNIKFEKGSVATPYSMATDDINNLETRVSSAELKITDDAIKATVESQTNTLISSALEDYSTTEEVESMLTMDDSGVAMHYQKKIDKAISNISVGGRNLVINSATMDNKFSQGGDFSGTKIIEDDEGALSKKHLKVTCTTAGPGFYCSVFPKTANKIGKTYIWSFEAKCSAERTGRVGHECGGILPNVTMSTNWKKYSYSWKFTDEVHQAMVFYLNFKQGDIFYLRDFKIEEGNVATAWTEAPEDAASRENERLQDFNTFIETTYTNDLAEIQKQIDKSITTWFSKGEPTLQKAPAAEWTTPEMKAQHLGDLYYDNETGYCYRFTLNGSTYSWVKITDTDVTKALQDAAKAQDTADGKRRVFVDTPVTPYDIGDLWVQGQNGDIMRCSRARQSGNYSTSDWVKASKYTDDSAANQAKQLATTLQNEFNNLSIGGRNLLWNSDFKSEFNPLTTTKNKYGMHIRGSVYTGERDTSVLRNSKPTLKIAGAAAGNASGIDILWFMGGIDGTLVGSQGSVTGEDIILSFYAKSTNSSVLSARLGYESYDDTKRVTLTTEWKYYTIQVASNASSNANNQIIMYLDKADTVWLSECKAEFGNIATDWSPAPEDTEMYIDDLAGDLQEQVDNKIESHSTTSDPSTAWNTPELKKQHKGDLWYNPSKKETKRWDLKGNGTYAWTLQTDGVAEALAQSKAQVFNTRPTKGRYNVGDLWINYTNVGEAVVKICKTARAEGVTGAESDWVESLKYTDDTAANNVSDDLHQNYSTTEEIESDIRSGENGIGIAFKQKISEIKIGARNLLVNTNRGKENWVWEGLAEGSQNFSLNEASHYGIKILQAQSSATSSTGRLQFLTFSPSHDFLKGQKYCIGFDIYLKSYATNINVQLQSLNPNPPNPTSFDLLNSDGRLTQSLYVKNGVWTSVEGYLTLGFSESRINGEHHLALSIDGLAGKSQSIEIANLRLELGNKVSDWTPAPEEGLETNEEYSQRISDIESSINMNKTGILARVQSVEDLLTKTEGAINQTQSLLSTAFSVAADGATITINKQNFTNLDNEVQTSITTVNSYSFSEEGLKISDSESPTETKINSSGMTVYGKVDSSGERREVLLTATDQGVTAKDLKANTYLKIGHARFEKYKTNRTGCFYINEKL